MRLANVKLDLAYTFGAMVESSFTVGTLFIAHKKKFEKELCLCIFPKVHCLQDPQRAKRIDELYERNLYRGFNYFKIAHFFSHQQ